MSRAIRGLDAHRVAEVIVTVPDGPARLGSGYLISKDAVLTAAHVVAGDDMVTVRIDAKQETEWSGSAQVIWFSNLVDAAVLRIAPPPGQEPVRPTEFGRMAEIDDEFPCSTVGFPRFKLRRGGTSQDVSQYRDSCHRLGRISGLSHRKEGTFEIRVDAPERDPDPRRSPWEAMSGAPVFVRGVMVGIVSLHHRSDGLGTLTASRMDRWHARLDGRALAALRAVTDFPGTASDLVEVAARDVRPRPAPDSGAYDVFLSYNPEDLAAAEQIADQLETYGLLPFLDRRHLPPGVPTLEVIEQAITTMETVAVLVGPGGLGPWRAEQLGAALDRSIRRQSDIRVLPVLLPGADPDALPPFLPRRLALDFRTQLDDPAAMAALVSGVRGRVPRRKGPSLPDSPAPYPSLRAFTEDEAGFFFGRSAEIEELARRVRTGPFTAVVGASGSGKSSLVLAGLLPRLGKEWTICQMVPGQWPLRTLADALAATMAPQDVLATAKRLERDLAESDDELAKTAGTIARLLPGRRVLLVIDQFEEIFAYGSGRSREFIANLYRAAREAPDTIHIAITLRADFFMPCLEFGELRELLPANQLLLGSLDDTGVREAVLQPAQKVGLLFEHGLVERIVDDMRGRPGALPLLQTALAGLWQRRRGVWVTHEDYDAIHGIGGALNQLAEELYAGLTPPLRDLAHQFFLRLVTLGESVTHTRRRVDRSELDFVSVDPQEIDELVGRLSSQDVRLVSVDRDTLELTHEALIDSWTTLRDWLQQDEADLRTHRQLTEDAQRWDAQGRDDSFLYRGLRLAGIIDWAARNGPSMNQMESAFLTDSRAVEDSAQAREQSDRTLARAGQAVFELDSSPEEAVLLAYAAGADAGETPLVQRSLFRVAETAKIQHVLRGHEDRISSVAWHPGGKIVATGSYDHTVRLWDFETDRPLATLRGHTDSVTCIAFDRTGERLVSGGWDNVARLWDVESFTEIATFTGHTSWVSSVSWSPSERYIATGSQDHTARVWEVSTGQTVCELAGHSEWVRSAEWHPDERLILTGGYDNVAKLWKIPSGRELATLTGHDGPVPAVAWSHDGSQALACSEDGTFSLWDMTKRIMLRRLPVHTSPVYCVAWSPTDRRAAVGSEDGRVRVFDVDSGSLLETLPGHQGWVSSVAWSPDGTSLISGSEDATARVASSRSGPPSREIGRHADWVSGAAWHPSGRMAATSGADGLVRIWDTASAIELTHLDAGDPLTAVTWSPRGGLVAAGSASGQLSVWDAHTWQIVFADRQAHSDRITALAWGPDETRLATSSYDQTATLWNTRTWQPEVGIQSDQWVVDLAWSPDGLEILFATWRNDAVIWRIGEPDEDLALRVLKGHTAGLHSADWSSSGRFVLTSSGDGTARVWDPATCRQTQRLGAGEAHTAAFNPQRQQVVTGSRDGGVRLWDIANGADLLVTYNHPHSILAAVWCPDGTEILTACEDGVIRIWPGSTAQIMEDLRHRIARILPPGELGRRFPHLASAD
ncbi:TIR domain-containing protein [Streptomyces sp. NPDC006602]|uniref:nSTAND1 domain-containing NTPase n=1 Tax=Streptomyces sp. NPDC006602 TaxID=3364751 RepID=UPI0036BB06C6